MLIVVSGQPRSGTTLVMTMLHRGGLPVYADSHTGYEASKVISLDRDNSFLYELSANKQSHTVIKILHPYITALPLDIPVKVIWMHRNAKDQAKSQRKLLLHAGVEVPRQEIHQLAKLTTRIHKKMTKAFKRSGISWLPVEYSRLKSDPGEVVKRLTNFLPFHVFDLPSMLACMKNNTIKPQPDLSVEMSIAEAVL
jgi:hypothetical protein